jgi:hypothetical protein
VLAFLVLGATVVGGEVFLAHHLSHSRAERAKPSLEITRELELLRHEVEELRVQQMAHGIARVVVGQGSGADAERESTSAPEIPPWIANELPALERRSS